VFAWLAPHNGRVQVHGQIVLVIQFQGHLDTLPGPWGAQGTGHKPHSALAHVSRPAGPVCPAIAPSQRTVKADPDGSATIAGNTFR